MREKKNVIIDVEFEEPDSSEIKSITVSTPKVQRPEATEYYEKSDVEYEHVRAKEKIKKVKQSVAIREPRATTRQDQTMVVSKMDGEEIVTFRRQTVAGRWAAQHGCSIEEAERILGTKEVEENEAAYRKRVGPGRSPH